MMDLLNCHLLWFAVELDSLLTSYQSPKLSSYGAPKPYKNQEKKLERGNEIAPLQQVYVGLLCTCAEDVQFYCPSHTYPVIPHYNSVAF